MKLRYWFLFFGVLIGALSPLCADLREIPATFGCDRIANHSACVPATARSTAEVGIGHLITSSADAPAYGYEAPRQPKSELSGKGNPGRAPPQPKTQVQNDYDHTHAGGGERCTIIESTYDASAFSCGNTRYGYLYGAESPCPGQLSFTTGESITGQADQAPAYSSHVGIPGPSPSQSYDYDASSVFLAAERIPFAGDADFIGPVDFIGPRLPAASATPLRLQYMGKTPGKMSRTGLDVQARMQAEGNLLRSGDGTMVRYYDAVADRYAWAPLSNMDMAHRVDAVAWWNVVGKQYGPKSPQVRAFMLDAKNYELQPYWINRSKGASLKESYQKF